jgi:hypothetical protein
MDMMQHKTLRDVRDDERAVQQNGQARKVLRVTCMGFTNRLSLSNLKGLTFWQISAICSHNPFI